MPTRGYNDSQKSATLSFKKGFFLLDRSSVHGRRQHRGSRAGFSSSPCGYGKFRGRRAKGTPTARSWAHRRVTFNSGREGGRQHRTHSNKEFGDNKAGKVWWSENHGPNYKKAKAKAKAKAKRQRQAR